VRRRASRTMMNGGAVRLIAKGEEQ
jgi:hypothetical protein